MAWKWYTITHYQASVGSDHSIYYGGIQLYGASFYAYLQFHKDGELPQAADPFVDGQRFYGHLEFRQYPAMVDLLRNEEPIRFGWDTAHPDRFHLMTGAEPVGEGDGMLATAKD